MVGRFNFLYKVQAVIPNEVFRFVYQEHKSVSVKNSTKFKVFKLKKLQRMKHMPFKVFQVNLYNSNLVKVSLDFQTTHLFKQEKLWNRPQAFMSMCRSQKFIAKNIPGLIHSRKISDIYFPPGQRLNFRWFLKYFNNFSEWHLIFYEKLNT